MWIPRSAPFASASLMVCLARSGPMEMATTSPPCFSFRRRDSSSAKLSGSLVSKPMSESRIHAPPSTMASGASFAGTCLTQTPIFIVPLSKPADKTLGLKTRATLFARPTLENQRRISAAKSKRIRKRILHGSFARVVWNVVQIALRIRIFVVHGRRQNLVAQRQNADTGLEAAGTAKEVTRHRFRRTDGNLLRALTEDALERRSFDRIRWE